MAELKLDLNRLTATELEAYLLLMKVKDRQFREDNEGWMKKTQVKDDWKIPEGVEEAYSQKDD